MESDGHIILLGPEEAHYTQDLQQWFGANGYPAISHGNDEDMSAGQWLEIAVASSQVLNNVISLAKAWAESRQIKVTVWKPGGRKIVVTQDSDGHTVANILDSQSAPTEDM